MKKTNGTTKFETHQTTQPASFVYDSDIDAHCRQHKELEQRLMSGTLEQAVDFFNLFGQYVRLGVTTTELRDEYLTHLKRRGISVSYFRYCEHHIGRRTNAEPGQIGHIQPTQIDKHLQALGYTPRGKHDCRAVLVSFFNFAQEAGCLPYAMAHAANRSTKFSHVR